MLGQPLQAALIEVGVDPDHHDAIDAARDPSLRERERRGGAGVAQIEDERLAGRDGEAEHAEELLAALLLHLVRAHLVHLEEAIRVEDGEREDEPGPPPDPIVRTVGEPGGLHQIGDRAVRQPQPPPDGARSPR